MKLIYEKVVAELEQMPKVTYEPPGPKSAAQIEELAKQAVERRVVTMLDVPMEYVSVAFLPFFSATIPWQYEVKKNIVILGVLGKHTVSQYSIGPWPIFLEVDLWAADDFVKAGDRAKALFRALDDVAMSKLDASDDFRGRFPFTG